MSVNASAMLILLAVTVVSLLNQTTHRSVQFQPALAGGEGTAVAVGGILTLAAIDLPTAWSQQQVILVDDGSATGHFLWATTWIGPKDAIDGPRKVAAALTRQGWNRCGVESRRGECWQQYPYVLVVAWGPAPTCPASGACWQGTVRMSVITG